MEQKKFDYNSFIGMILLAGIFLYWMNTTKPDIEPETASSALLADAASPAFLAFSAAFISFFCANPTMQKQRLATNKNLRFIFKLIKY